MSRVGKSPISIPSNIKIFVAERNIEVVSSATTHKVKLPDSIELKLEEDKIILSPKTNSKTVKALWGTTQRCIKNLIEDLSKGITLTLDLVGVGYRASVQANKLSLQLGFSHDVHYVFPDNISIRCEKPTSISITGNDRQLVGQIASEIRNYRKPEPYKGKGVIRQGEFLIRKEGKKK